MTNPPTTAVAIEIAPEIPAAPAATASPEPMTPSSVVQPMVEQASKIAALEATVRNLEAQIVATNDHATRAELEAQRTMLETRLDALTPPPVEEAAAVEVLTVDEPPVVEEPPPVAAPVKTRHPLDFLF